MNDDVTPTSNSIRREDEMDEVKRGMYDTVITYVLVVLACDDFVLCRDVQYGWLQDTAIAIEPETWL